MVDIAGRVGASFQPLESVAPSWHYGLSRFGESITDWRPIWTAILEDYKISEAALFSSEGSSGGERWMDLTPAYSAWKEAVNPGKQILYFSGLLRNAATNPRVIMTEDHMTLKIDDSGPYSYSNSKGTVHRTKKATAAFHHFGRGMVPERKVIQFPEAQIRRWQKIIQTLLVAQRSGGTT